MVGANYMGGKRSTVRSRGRDKDAGIQRSHFGKQKLHMLSKGILSSSSGRDEQRGGLLARSAVGMADISLAHARQKIPPRNEGERSNWIPRQAYVPMCSSPAGDSRRFGAHISSLTKPKAKIIQALEVSEPYFLKELLERIKNTPDLVGLSRQDPPIKAPDQRQEFEQSKIAEDDDRLHTETPRMSPEHDQYTGQWSSRSPPSFSSMEIPDSSEHRYFDEPSVQAGNRTSSSRPFQLLSSPPTSISRRSFGARRLEVGADDMAESSPSEASLNNDSENIFDERGLPLVIRFPNQCEMMKSQSVYGNLFHHQDPWAVIGEILDRGQEFSASEIWESDSGATDGGSGGGRSSISPDANEETQRMPSPLDENLFQVADSEFDEEPFEDPQQDPCIREAVVEGGSMTFELHESQEEMNMNEDPGWGLGLLDEPNLLAMHELAQVDGRYLGPSLFGHESDDEQ